jgi:hypothetical protein
MKALKIVVISFLTLLLLFLVFRLITNPSGNAGIVTIIVASSLAGTTTGGDHWFGRKAKTVEVPDGGHSDA